MDFGRLRDQALHSTQDEEAVTVNTRALIDKVLARYSGEWTTLRELLQNAANASAKKVSIKFETLPSSTVPTPHATDKAAQLKHTVQNHTVKRVIVTNDGVPFNDNDWNRLKRIAEGNPDETKIGAFGVGFYSVFDECENPFVVSGNQSLAFYWKGNSLFTRRGAVPNAQNKDTSFVLDYRNTSSPVPNLMSISQFLSTSLTFVGLESVELWLDDWKVFVLNKKAAPSTTAIRPTDIDPKTKEGMMKITSFEHQNAQIDATWMNIVGWTAPVVPAAGSLDTESRQAPGPSLRGFFSRLAGTGQNSAAAKRAAKEEEEAQQLITENIDGLSTATIFIRVSTAHVNCTVSSKFASELERATKKPPPKTTKIAILTSSFDETQASLSTLSGASSKKVSEVVTSILPSKAGRVFIGFPTTQTTGLKAHVSAPSLIPTVERENIDLNARYILNWNSELLRVAGIACRMAYAGELDAIKDKVNALKKAGAGDGAASQLVPAAVHCFRQYTFKETTPLPKAGQMIEEAFWMCSKKASIDIFSTQGVLPSHEVRIASEDLSFVKGIPLLQDAIIMQAGDFIAQLQSFGLISDITTSDIKAELEKQALSEAQLEEFLKWSAKKIRTKEMETSVIQSLFQVAIVNIHKRDNISSGVLDLGSIDSFLNSSRISPDLPVPPQTIPFRFTKSVANADLQSFGWEELQLIPWIRFLVKGAQQKTFPDEVSILASPTFAAQILQTCSKGYDSLSQSSKGTLVDILSPLPIIPTKFGMKVPNEAYFQSVKLFDDLPTTKLDGVKEKFLKALGVRKTIDLSVIFERLMSANSAGSGKWSHVDLIKYLVSVWDDIPEKDIELLRGTAMCPAEKEHDRSKPTEKRYQVAELYEPKDSLRALGLPVLQWPGHLNMYSSEGKFLKSLGLRPHPSVPELVQLLSAAGTNLDVKLYEEGLRYFVDNHYQNNYGRFDLSDVEIKFLPIDGMDKLSLARPKDCFTNASCQILGYKALRQDLKAHALKLGVSEHPNIGDCAMRLIKDPPRDRRAARELFAYFASRSVDISPNIASRLATSRIIPIKTTSATADGPNSYKLVTPDSCYLGDGEEYGDIFDYVDFGPEANVFLIKIGSKHEPTTSELTRHVIREPARIFERLGVDKYQGLLRKLCVNISTLKKDKVLWKEMKQMPFLLAYREVPQQKTSGDLIALSDNSTDDPDDDDDDDAAVREWHLARSGEIVIIDDIISFSLFKKHVMAAPQEEELEELYQALGSPRIGGLVETEPRLGGFANDQSPAETLKVRVVERARLFLAEQPETSVIHDAKWLEKNLHVQVVQSLSLRLSLRGTRISHSEKRSAYMASTSKHKALLCITANYESFDVSQEIVQVLIDRPRTQSKMLFEMILTTPLHKLKSRGYNVDRFLRRRAIEQARVAEQERQRQIVQEQQRAQEIEKARDQVPVDDKSLVRQSAQSVGSKSELDSPMKMPGSFNDSPVQKTHEDDRSSKNFFSNLSKSLGFKGDDHPLKNTQISKSGRDSTAPQLPGLPANPFGTSNPAEAPPGFSPYDPQSIKSAPTSKKIESATHPVNTQQNLQSAINASRAYNSNSLFAPPETKTVKETQSYCDSQPSHNLALVSTTSNGMRVFHTKNSDSDPSYFVSANHGGLETFAALIQDVGDNVFGLKKGTLQIFFDEQSSAIAFNSNGSLFCNFRFFAQLHLNGMNHPGMRAQALIYWFVILCHELAHNLVKDHSSAHSFYTEQFVIQYFPTACGRVGQMAMEGARAGIEGGNMVDGAFNGVERAFS